MQGSDRDLRIFQYSISILYFFILYAILVWKAVLHVQMFEDSSFQQMCCELRFRLLRFLCKIFPDQSRSYNKIQKQNILFLLRIIKPRIVNPARESCFYTHLSSDRWAIYFSQTISSKNWFVCTRLSQISPQT